MEPLSSSFRDPSGFMFSHQGCIYRQVNNSFSATYDNFMHSGLYNRLVDRGLLISHEEVVDGSARGTVEAYRIIKPLQIPFISYPYEWSFSQLKDAAMLTLKIQYEALKYGFVLKDASAYNVQFLNSKPVFIDTLSFARYTPGKPWVAYKQFCQHFLAPLALMAYTDVALSKLLITHIDGVPLSLASKLLPVKTRLNYSLMSHIHLHSKIQQQHADDAGDSKKTTTKNTRLSEQGLKALLESLAKTVQRLSWKMPRTEWGDYYEKTNYSDLASEQKRALVDNFLRGIPDTLEIIQDFGANTGEFSCIAAKHGALVISQDIDPVAVELNYRRNSTDGPTNILPLIQDFSAPSPGIGWGNAERASFLERSRCDALLVLALIHHLAISNNVPLQHIATLFAGMTDWIIIEFVPKSDSQVKRLLATRDDIFTRYTKEGFEHAFSGRFSIEQSAPVPDSERTLYLMKARSAPSTAT
ncbi:MAG: SAM-dependent methyltransferase [Halioglobus sp.]|nr:SAM-dependent methyltransferase [Halioglobus sp.]